MPTDKESRPTGGSQKMSSRVRNTMLIFVLGLLVQAGIIGLALPGKAQDDVSLVGLRLDAPARAVPGQSFNVTFTITSAITDTITAVFGYSLSPHENGVIEDIALQSSRSSSCGADGDVASCALSLPPGDTQGIITVLPITGTITHTASVSSPIGSAFDVQTTEVESFPAALNIHFPASAALGSYLGELQVTPTITFTNAVLTGTLTTIPSDVVAVYRFAGAVPGNCDPVGITSTTFRCAAPTLAAGESWLISVEVEPFAPGTNLHSFSISTADGFISNPITSTTRVEESSLPDTDGDGTPDLEDACPASDLTPTVVIDGCDSGVENFLFDDGCTLADLIQECVQNAPHHGAFVSCVSQLTNDLKKQGDISGRAKSSLQSCAARSRLP